MWQVYGLFEHVAEGDDQLRLMWAGRVPVYPLPAFHSSLFETAGLVTGMRNCFVARSPLAALTRGVFNANPLFFDGGQVWPTEVNVRAGTLAAIVTQGGKVFYVWHRTNLVNVTQFAAHALVATFNPSDPTTFVGDCLL